MVKEGDTVTVEYTGTLEDGTVFDSSEKHGQPLKFTLGEKQVIPGFENAVGDLKEGEETEVTIPPAEAYGEPRDELIQQVPRSELPDGVQEGMMLQVGLPNGQRIPARITSLTDDEATLDVNHPLAGKTLNFKIKLVGVE